ncbi:hypothetical protein B0I37DRAFT_156475 [Chaetomium sp. MPI-CAGE-AT-0009]|nr:hypothetical protein B0I37DRAFT_156475 [Chaetomium sp. MPI-CAGE-AT-0009]
MSWPVATKFASIIGTKIYNNRPIVMTRYHDVQTTSESNLKEYRDIQNFAWQHGFAFYPTGRGIGPQIMIEEDRYLCVATWDADSGIRLTLRTDYMCRCLDRLFLVGARLQVSQRVNSTGTVQSPGSSPAISQSISPLHSVLASLCNSPSFKITSFSPWTPPLAN